MISSCPITTQTKTNSWKKKNSMPSSSANSSPSIKKGEATSDENKNASFNARETLASNFPHVALGLFYMFLESFALLIFIEMPLGPLIRMFHTVLDPHNEYRDICQNCTYIVNKADIMAMKPTLPQPPF